MIPKIIHYCWVGPKEMPELERKCIESWDKFLPDYQKIFWNEDSFDINSNLFVKQAYGAKKYAFVSDYIRLYALYHYGGIYMDTDVEVIKSLDRFLTHPAFSGFESPGAIPTGAMGAVKGHPWINRLLEYYKDKSFYFDNGSMDLTTNVKIITDISEREFGLVKGNNNFQVLNNDVHIYPTDYFCPKEWWSRKMAITDNTHTIHHFSNSWF
ncbi:glycosyltransferase family 32 protein [Anaerobacillus arseniciselenatis]|uniref:glycosyltransferase family 32 protein n=1 Tax=Anaerobacillus arseniciselenatis TaxID=85682 RepID=UPI000A065FD7|nr:glycosyltransferase [Anaerobacillus arseniciselenatis]